MQTRTMIAAVLAFAAGVALVLLIRQAPRDDAHAQQPKAAKAAPAAPWLRGTPAEKFAQIETHLRGLDLSMVEIGQRYDELVLAGKFRNWEYLKYQTEKIDLSLRLAIERRPKRAKSAEPFLKESIPPVLEAIKARSAEKLDLALKNLHTGCIQCHRAENVLFMGTQFATIQPISAAADRAIRDYQRILTPKYLATADRSRGRQVYAKHCANCHRLFGEGGTIGPDLAGLQRSNLDYLLTRMVAPNALIGHDYQMVVVLTADGRTITGLVKQEDQKALTIQTDKESVVIRKDEIEKRSVSIVSMMPDGLLQKVTNEQVRDLIGYLQGADQAPLPAEKSEGDGKKAQPGGGDANLREEASKLFGVIKAVPEAKLSEPDVTLGRALFWDTRLSGNGKTACASCHAAKDGGADLRRFSPDAKGKNTARNAQTVFNAVLQPSLRWTGDRKSGAHQAEKSLTGSMGLASAEAVVPLLKDLGYEAAFKSAYPKDADPISPANYAGAIQAYEATLVTPAPFDRFLGGKDDALDAKQKVGLKVFMGSGCADCHKGPLLGGGSLAKFGVAKDYWTATKSEKKDAGLFEATKKEADRYKFRVSMLRNIAKTAPYFHDGSVAELREAVQVMVDVQLGSRLSESDAAAIVSFLDGLTGEVPKNYGPPKAVAPEGR